MHDLMIIPMLFFSMLPQDDQRAAVAFFDDPPCTSLDAPAIMHAYDPALGGINCDGDCTTVATGKLEPEMYGVAGACHSSLMGSTIHFDDIDESIKCVDTGGLIGPGWSERDNMCVVYFDMLLPLEVEDNKIINPPYWNHWLLDNWRITWNN